MGAEEPITINLQGSATKFQINPARTLEEVVSSDQAADLDPKDWQELGSKYYDARWKVVNPDADIPEREYLLRKTQRLNELGLLDKNQAFDAIGQNVLGQANQLQAMGDAVFFGLPRMLRDKTGITQWENDLKNQYTRQAIDQGMDPEGTFLNNFEGQRIAGTAGGGLVNMFALGGVPALAKLGPMAPLMVQSAGNNAVRVANQETTPLAGLVDFGIDTVGAKLFPGLSSRLKNVVQQGVVGGVSGGLSSAVNQAQMTGKVNLGELIKQGGLGALLQGVAGGAFPGTPKPDAMDIAIQRQRQMSEGDYGQRRAGPIGLKGIEQQGPNQFSTGLIKNVQEPMTPTQRLGEDVMARRAMLQQRAQVQQSYGDGINRVEAGVRPIPSQELPQQMGPMSPMRAQATGEYHGQPKVFEAAIEMQRQNELQAQAQAKQARAKEITDKFTNPVMDLILQGRDTAAELKLQQFKAVLKSKTAPQEAKEIVADVIDYINQFKAEVRAQRKADARAGRKADTTGAEPRPQAEPAGQADELRQLVDDLSPPEARSVETPQTPELQGQAEVARVQPANALPGFELIANHPIVQSRPDLIEALNSGKPVDSWYNAERTGSRDESTVGHKFDLPVEFAMNAKGEPMVKVINENGQQTTRILEAFDKIATSDKPFPFKYDREGTYVRTGEKGKMRVLDAQGNEVAQGTTGFQKTSDSFKDLGAVGLKGVRSAIRKGKNVSVTEVKTAVAKAKAALDTITAETLGTEKSYRSMSEKAETERLQKDSTPEQRRKIHKDVTGRDC